MFLQVQALHAELAEQITAGQALEHQLQSSEEAKRALDKEGSDARKGKQEAENAAAAAESTAVILREQLSFMRRELESAVEQAHGSASSAAQHAIEQAQAGSASLQQQLQQITEERVCTHALNISVVAHFMLLQNNSIFELAELRQECASHKQKLEEAQRHVAALQAQISSASTTAASLAELHAAQSAAKKAEEQVRYLEGIVHQECLERTYLLDQLNDLRAQHQLPPLRGADVSQAASQQMQAQPPPSARSTHSMQGAPAPASAGSVSSAAPAGSAAAAVWQSGNNRLARDKGVRRRGR